MTPKPKGPGHGDGDGPDGGSGSGRHRGAGGGAENIARAQDTVDTVMKRGRGGNSSPGTGSRPGGQAEDSVTSPTGQVGGTPEGNPTRIKPGEDFEVRRSLEMENSGAEILAAGGHHVTQNPTPEEVAAARAASGDTGKPTSKPDYLVDGRVFDCYSPRDNKNARGVASEVTDKVDKGQTQRVVINMEDWHGTLPDLRKQFADWPVDGLKELKAITPEGEIVQIDLTPAND